tara:strand:+ start:43 stop:594 length:552 start_codon:yes stop_codon:yes gene_type:complete
MNNIKKILLATTITPFIIILLISVLNQNKSFKVNLLLWELPKTKIGNYIAIAGSLGFCISSLSIYITSTNNKYSYTRKISTQDSEGNAVENKFNEYREQIATEEYINPIERDVRDPAPTVTVPFRVISNNNDINDNFTSNYPASREFSKTISKNDIIQPNNGNEESVNIPNNDEWGVNISEQW